MASGYKGKKPAPKEIAERVKQMKEMDEVVEVGSSQAAAMVDNTLKMFVKSKMATGINEKYAIEMAISGASAVLADLFAHAYLCKYSADVQEDIIKVAQKIHEVSANIVIQRQNEKGSGSNIIILPPEKG